MLHHFIISSRCHSVTILQGTGGHQVKQPRPPSDLRLVPAARGWPAPFEDSGRKRTCRLHQGAACGAEARPLPNQNQGRWDHAPALGGQERPQKVCVKWFLSSQKRVSTLASLGLRVFKKGTTDGTVVDIPCCSGAMKSGVFYVYFMRSRGYLTALIFMDINSNSNVTLCVLDAIASLHYLN